MNDPLEATPPQTEDPSQNNDEKQSNGLALAAMITGVVGLILSVIPIIGLLSWILCPAAIIMGLLGLGKQVGKGLAITGIGTGALGLLICIAWVTIFAAAGSWISNFIEEENLAEEINIDDIVYMPPATHMAPQQTAIWNGRPSPLI